MIGWIIAGFGMGISFVYFLFWNYRNITYAGVGHIIVALFRPSFSIGAPYKIENDEN